MNQLTEEQKREATLVASLGCDRELITRYLGCEEIQLVETLANDEAFYKAWQRANATVELSHIRNIQQAAKDEKNWRASVWWLERHVPARYAKRSLGEVTRNELVKLIRTVAEKIASVVKQPEDQKRLLTKLSELAEQIEDDFTISEEPGLVEEENETE